MSGVSISCGVKVAGATADNLAAFMSRLSRNYGSFNLQQLSGPAQASIGNALHLAFPSEILVHSTKGIR
jgi:hypothetical protein